MLSKPRSGRRGARRVGVEERERGHVDSLALQLNAGLAVSGTYQAVKLLAYLPNAERMNERTNGAETRHTDTKRRSSSPSSSSSSLSWADWCCATRLPVLVGSLALPLSNRPTRLTRERLDGSICTPTSPRAACLLACLPSPVRARGPALS